MRGVVYGDGVLARVGRLRPAIVPGWPPFLTFLPPGGNYREDTLYTHGREGGHVEEQVGMHLLLLLRWSWGWCGAWPPSPPPW